MKAMPRHRGKEGESGASAIELVLWTPLLFFLLFATVQLGLYLFAQHIAMTAAQEGDRAAREDYVVDNSTWQSYSQGVAKNWATQMIGSMITDPAWAPVATLNQPSSEISMSVAFSIVSVVPGWQLAVSATIEGPIECFYVGGQCAANNP